MMSRNLTFDRSWDVSISIEGHVTSELQTQNNSMIEMLDYFEEQSTCSIEQIYKNDLSKVKFKLDPRIKSWSFYPIGISESHTNPLINRYYHPEILIMISPFVDDESIKSIAEKATEEVWLFSRKVELHKIEKGTFDCLDQSYCIPDNIVNGELIDTMNDDLSNTHPEPLDLHAKLYISRKKETITWLLGSANLTQPAFGRNIEALFELKTDDKEFGPESIFKELVSTEDENKLFEEYKPLKIKQTDPDANIARLLRKLEYEIIKCQLKGEIIPDERDKYFSYRMVFDASKLRIEKDFKVYIQTINNNITSDYGKDLKSLEPNVIVLDDQLKESQLSKYFIFTITYKNEWKKSFLLMAEISLPESRHGKILAEIINSKEKFLQYLRLLLSNSGIVDEIDTNEADSKSKPSEDQHNSIFALYDFPLYEELLKAAAQNPEKLRRINELITKLTANDDTKDVVTPELLQLWSVFKEVIA